MAEPASVPLPTSGPAAATASIALHMVAVTVAVTMVAGTVARTEGGAAPPAPIAVPEHVVFIARESRLPISGGGGGGNRQPAPIRRAAAPGTDRITLRTAEPPSRRFEAVESPAAPAHAPHLLLDAVPLASGSVDQIGLPSGGVSFGTATGPGSGGGVGTGVGTGIGSGRGPGLGDGSGGGTGGGVYRPGGAVSDPRVIREVKPTYTTLALADRIQGSVVLAFVVQANGVPANIRVVRSLDPNGLDNEAIAAVSQWRFEPGRLAGRPVDVVVSVILDFTIH